MQSHKLGRVASLIGVEGGHSIGTSLGVLRMFYQLGARYLTITHTCNTLWADCCLVDEPGRVPHIGGLSHFGTVGKREWSFNVLKSFSLCPSVSAAHWLGTRPGPGPSQLDSLIVIHCVSYPLLGHLSSAARDKRNEPFGDDG